jgi:hypothetical protein
VGGPVTPRRGGTGPTAQMRSLRAPTNQQATYSNQRQPPCASKAAGFFRHGERSERTTIGDRAPVGAISCARCSHLHWAGYRKLK